MKRIYIFSLITLFTAFLFIACSDEDSLTPSEIESLSRFEFPEGTNQWDNGFNEIYENHGVQLIYKSFTLRDLNKTWIGIGGNSARFEYYEDSDELMAINEILNSKVFSLLDPELSKRVFPPYIYLPKNYQLPLWEEFYLPSYLDATGFDFWIISLPPNLTSPDLQGQASFTEKHMPGRIISEYFRSAIILKNHIDIPREFYADTDYNTQILLYDNQRDDPNYFLNRGLCHNTSFQSGRDYVFGYPNITNNPEFTRSPERFDFWNFVMMLTVNLDYQTTYANYPLVKRKADLVLQYMLDEYNIDLQAIARLSPYNE